MSIGIFIAGLIFGIVLTLWLRRGPTPPAVPIARPTATTPPHDAPGVEAASTDALALPSPEDRVDADKANANAAESAAEDTPRDRIYRARRALENDDSLPQRPEDLRRVPEFRTLVALLADPALPAQEVLEQLEGGSDPIGCAVWTALAERGDIAPAAALAACTSPGGRELRFILDHLMTQPDAEALPALLRHLRPWWYDEPLLRRHMRAYLERVATLPPPTRPMALEDLDDYALEGLGEGLKAFALPVLAPWLAECHAESARRREQRTLGVIGRLWRVDDGGFIPHPQADRHLERMLSILNGERPRSILVSGAHGSGKSALVQRLLFTLHHEGWLLFEASAAEVLAGQMYIGQLEERLRELLSVLKRPRALWRVEDFHDLLNKGSHQQDPRGILDLLLPAIERGELVLIGELTPAQAAHLALARPALRPLVEQIVLEPLDDTAMRELLSRWRSGRNAVRGTNVIAPVALEEARRMAAQFFPEQTEPGRSLRLLEDTLAAAEASDPPALPLTADDLLHTIARRSGLPLAVIDDRESLDLDALRAFLRKRVLGQDEAVECLVDRIAMLKAGLVDAGRPIGVFLFAGPTGTGKTELAKALGELLFGSDERLLRLDMSEFQSDDAVWRLTESPREGGARSLVARIREQPFSVVLLDEFEKAHPGVWDLFLQVFDDGRLSDRSGNVADFRHSILILTSNVGSTLGRGAGPGFTAVAGGWSRSAVEKALFETFRREFLNRLDRIVLFNPLDRALMREILHKELERAMGRRGLRNRDWAVEWEPSAIEFLLDRGFTPDLGARPLRRAIEQHLLAPLARSIVEHRTPQGDQFLFVRSAGDRLEVEFVDPDPPVAAREPAAAAGDLRSLLWAADASPAAVATLRAAFAGLSALLGGDAWAQARAADFAAMQTQDFWSRPDRFVVLDRIERRERIESAFDTAQRLDARLARDGADAGFVARHAQLLWLLQLAADAAARHEPQDALLWIAAGDTDLRRDPARTRRWWQDLLAMYRAWAARRNMRIDVLEDDADTCRARLAMGGFGALAILEHEQGLHLLEYDADNGASQRVAVAVRVAADLPGQARPKRPDGDDDPRIVRRYRAEPSPLVRDGVRSWRSGRLDRVLAGEFDAVPLD